jgi:hypothetical protein
MDAGERDLFASGLRHATARHSGAALDAALDDLGWREALTADPRVAVSLLFELQGAACGTSSALDAVVAAALGMAPEGGAGVVLPPLGRTDPPGEVVGESIAVGGLGTAGLGRHERAVVAARAGEGWVATVVDTADLDRRTVQGLDPDLGLVEVAGAHVRALPPPEPPPVPWPSAVAAGQRALAHELVGASRAMLGMARDHALERIQFGRPIASFQAVRHRLAESFVAVEAADAALAAAWDDGSALGAAVAKAVAGRSARTAARHCQQVLAGIGFTTEHPLHRYVRRVVVLDRLLGDARSLTRSLGDDLVVRGSLPSILPL